MLPPDEYFPPEIDITSGFFFFDVPKNVEEVLAYQTRLVAYHEELVKKPITPPYNLTLTEQRPHINRHNRHNIKDSLEKRAIPDLFVHSAFHELDALQLVLTHPLAVGQLKWSQVWRGTLASRNALHIRPAPVVVKIYQESFFKYLPTYEDIIGTDDDWRPGALTAALEAWDFDQLRSMQGETLPWSYGCYKVVLPNGEAAFAHVMEVIEGIPASSPLATVEALKLTDGDIWNFADSMGKALHQIHSHGFCHGDLNGNNVILLNTSDTCEDKNFRFVIIDFGLIMFLESMEPRRKDPIKMQDATGIHRVLEDLGVPSNKFDLWNKSRMKIQPEWRTMFTYIDEYYNP